MDEKTVKDALVLMKRTGNLLNELEDLTQQIAQSADRNDRVSMEMLLAMREEPLQSLQAADRALRDQLEDLPNRETAAKLARMLNGGSPAQAEDPLQKLLCEQVAANRRRLRQVIELDRRVNQRLSGEQPSYT